MISMPLREAQQIVNRIKRETQFEYEEPHEYYGQRRRSKVQVLNVTATVNIDSSPVETVKRLRVELIEKRDQILRLIQIGSKIRQTLGAAQAEEGVSPLVTERVATLQRQQFLETLLMSVERSVFDENQFKGQVKAISTRLSNPASNVATTELTTPLLTAEDRDGMRRDLADAKRRVLAIDNELARRNSSRSIEIEDNDMEFLQQVGIA